MELTLFYVLACLTAAAALSVVLQRDLVRSALGLLFTLLGIASLYFLLGAEFLGAVQLMVYVGGTMVLVVFGVMMTATGPRTGPIVRRLDWIIGGALALGIFAALAVASLNCASPGNEEPLPGIEPLGLAFLGLPEKGQTPYLLPFEIISVHLLVVLVAAAYLARAKRKAVRS